MIIPNKSPIFPSPWYLVLHTLILFFIITASQIIEPKIYTRKWLIQRNLLASLPPLLGTIIVWRWIKANKPRKDYQGYILGAIILLIIFIMLSFTYIFLILLIYAFGKIPGHAFYLLLIGILGFIGITLADSLVFYSSNIRITPHEFPSRYVVFRQLSSKFLIRLFYTPTRRVLILILLNVLAILIYFVVPGKFISPVSL